MVMHRHARGVAMGVLGTNGIDPVEEYSRNALGIVARLACLWLPAQQALAKKLIALWQVGEGWRRDLQNDAVECVHVRGQVVARCSQHRPSPG